ncbi:tetratricopeptide repeat protein [Luteimonas sp. A478]
MVAFIILSALLAVAAAMVLAGPLRGQSRRTAIAVALSVPLLATGLYLLVGTPDGLDPGQRQAPTTMEEAVALLEADLERDPLQGEGWRLLGRAYAEMGRYEDARDALGRAARLDPENPGILTEHAEAIASVEAAGGFTAEARALLERALQIDPSYQRARLFLGIAQRQAGEDALAAETWEPLLTVLGPQAAAGLLQQINAARGDAGMEPLADIPQAADAPSSPNAVQVRVTVDPEFAAMVRLDPDAVVFVAARVPGGSPMPVAAQRRLVRDLPLELTLDDSDAVMPTQALSTVEEVELVARISSTGTASAQEGDITSTPVRIKLPTDGPVELVLGALD